MVRVLKEICRVRDILISGDDKLISNPWNSDSSGLYEKTAKKIKEVVGKKYSDRDYELDITSQDLRELAGDIKAVLKRWDDTLNAEENIKELMEQAAEKRLNLGTYLDKALPVMCARVDASKQLLNLLNIAEYAAVIIYLLEVCTNDAFALQFTERFEVLK